MAIARIAGEPAGKPVLIKPTLIERATTAADGTFTFRTELDRNHRLRVSAPAQSLETKYAQAYVLPGFELSEEGS